MALNASGLTAEIQKAMRQEWKKEKGTSMTDAALEDIRLLFAAVARGLLNYLEDNQDELIRTITLEIVPGQPARYTVSGTNLDISRSS